MTAHVAIRPTAAPRITVNCPPCGITEAHARHRPAQAAAREHNQARHASPADRRSRDTLDSTDHEEHS